MKLGDLPIGTIFRWHSHIEYMLLPTSTLLKGVELFKEENRVPVLCLSDLSVGWDYADATDFTLVK